jgi:hypothetical protein
MRALLSALLDDALRRLPREPNLHDKRILGLQAYEDALSLSEMGGREDGGSPDREALVARARERLAILDAVTDEFRILTELVRRQERHALDLPPGFIIHEPETTPARDPFVEIGPESPGPHADLNAALIVAEVAAATAAETPLEVSLRLTELAVARLDETVEIEKTLDAPWGSEPVALDRYDELMGLAVDDRVEQLLGESARRDEDAAV